MHAMQTAVRPAITDKLLAEIFPPTSSNLAILELAYQGAVQTPLKALADRLNFVEWMAIHVGLTIARLSDEQTQSVWRRVVANCHGLSWGVDREGEAREYQTFQAFVQDTLGQGRGLYPVVHDVNNLAFPILKRDTQICHLPPEQVATYRKMNPYQGRNLEKRLEDVSDRTLAVLHEKIVASPTDFEDQLHWLPNTRDLRADRRGHEIATSRRVKAYRKQYGELLRQYPQGYDANLGLDPMPRARYSRAPPPVQLSLELALRSRP
ncbi:MAG: hypothetical protein AABX70_02465 [Nanoarchaeota archaeon]